VESVKEDGRLFRPSDWAERILIVKKVPCDENPAWKPRNLDHSALNLAKGITAEVAE
jgi:hypothetical protein